MTDLTLLQWLGVCFALWFVASLAAAVWLGRQLKRLDDDDGSAGA